MISDDLPFAVHLSFNGACMQAFSYYQECFGGELNVQTLADTPHCFRMSRQMRKVVICATLKNEYFKLVGTDLTDESGIIPGNNVSIFIECGSLEERTKLVDSLRGERFYLENNTDRLVNITDKFNIRWVLSAE